MILQNNLGKFGKKVTTKYQKKANANVLLTKRAGWYIISQCKGVEIMNIYEEELKYGRTEYKTENLIALMEASKRIYVEVLLEELKAIKNKKSAKYGFLKAEIADINNLNAYEFMAKYAIDGELEHLNNSLVGQLIKITNDGATSPEFDANNADHKAVLLFRDAINDWAALTPNEQIEAKTYEVFDRAYNLASDLFKQGFEIDHDEFFYGADKKIFEHANQICQKEKNTFESMVYSHLNDFGACYKDEKEM